MLTHHKFSYSGQAKPKKAKVSKPAEDPKTVEFNQPPPLPEQFEAPEDPVVNIHPVFPEPSVDETTRDLSTIEPISSVKPPETHGDDILITGSRFVEPGNPTMLAKHSAKQEVMERQKVRFDVSHYAHLSISNVLSGYLSQAHSNRDSEIEMVK